MKLIKSGNSAFQVQATEYRNTKYVDVRRMYQNADGAWKPTPKGVMLPLDVVEKVLRAIKLEQAQAGEEPTLLPQIVYVVASETYFKRALAKGHISIAEDRVFENRFEALACEPSSSTHTMNLYKLKYDSVELREGRYEFQHPVYKLFAQWQPAKNSWRIKSAISKEKT